MKIRFNPRITALFVLIAGLMLLASCENKETVTACLTGHTYGFWAACGTASSRRSILSECC